LYSPSLIDELNSQESSDPPLLQGVTGLSIK
jgi:hypothetical protein